MSLPSLLESVNTQLAPQDITHTCEKWIDKIAEHVSGAPRIYIDRTREILRNDQQLIGKENELAQHIPNS